MFALGAVSLLTFSCKEELAEPTAYEGTATIEGIVYINSDQTEGDTEVPDERAANVTVRISYDSDDLSVVSDGSGQTVVLTTTTDANGNFSITVPATNDGVDYTIETDQITISYTVSEYPEGDPVTVTKEGVFNGDETTASPLIGETEFVELNYGSGADFDLTK